LLRKALGAVLARLGSVLSEKELLEFNQQKEIEDLWHYHEFVEHVIQTNPDPLFTQALDDSISDVQADIIGTLMQAQDKE